LHRLSFDGQAMHTQNLKEDSRCSLFAGQASADNGPLGAARATLVGRAAPVPEEGIARIREQYLARHENSRYWVDFSDFSFFRLQPVDLYYVGGFGVMGWVEAGDYEPAAPDPLANAAPGILAHMNTDPCRCDDPAGQGPCRDRSNRGNHDFGGSFGLLAQIESDRLDQGARINFLHEVATAQDTRAVLVEMVRQAKA
jgi:heme iron utilization protein